MDRPAGQIFDDAAISVARGEIHGGEIATRPQLLVDQTDALEELRPIQFGYEPHTGDDIAHGDVRGALPEMLFAHYFIGVGALRTQALIQPLQGGRCRRVFIAQPLHKLYHERACQRCICI